MSLGSKLRVSLAAALVLGVAGIAWTVLSPQDETKIYVAHVRTCPVNVDAKDCVRQFPVHIAMTVNGAFEADLPWSAPLWSQVIAVPAKNGRVLLTAEQEAPGYLLCWFTLEDGQTAVGSRDWTYNPGSVFCHLQT